MSSDSNLEYILYRKQRVNSTETQEVVAMSSGLTTQDANLWRGLVSLTPFPDRVGKDSETVGIFGGPDQDFILARAHHPEDEPERTLYQYTNIPTALYERVSGNLRILLEHTRHPLEDGDEVGEDEVLTPLDPPPIVTWATDRRQELFKLIHDRHQLAIPDLFRILGAALDKRKLLITNAEADLDARLDLIEAITLMVPSAARARFTFSTNVKDAAHARGRIVFCDDTANTERWVVDLEAQQLPDDAVLEHGYLKLLDTLWHDDVENFVNDLRALDRAANHFVNGKTISEGLSALANRQQLNRKIQTGEEASIADIQAVLDDTNSPEGTLRNQYLQRLLNHALEEREADAVELLLRHMENDDAVEHFVYDELRNNIETAPDDVYAFIRSSLTHGVDPEKLGIMQDAARDALEMAMVGTDRETLLTWMKLLAREPAEYGLDEILHEGIRELQTRTHADGELGSDLLRFVSRRVPDMIDTLLADEELIAKLSDPIGGALRDFDPEQVTAVLNIGREISLVVLRQAVEAAPENPQAAALFDNDTVNYLWALKQSELNPALPEKYHPQALVEMLIEAADTWLPNIAVIILLDNIIGAEELGLLEKLSPQIRQKSALLEEIVSACQSNATSAEVIIEITDTLLKEETITRQETVDLLLQLAAKRDWAGETSPLIERAIRLLQQHPELEIPLENLWPMLQIASGEEKLESVASTVTRRILHDIQGIQDENAFVEMLVRLHRRIEWSKSLRAYLMNWWREHVHQQPLARLQQLERATEAHKELNEERGILQTTLAIRRMIGQRTIDEFVQAVATTYNLLQAISESFDPNYRQISHFDAQAVKDELDRHADRITPDEQRVLAKNLKELAQLIINMSEYRSKPALMRREEDLERQLIAGDQEPQSAIDTMRWLSGFLNGLQASTQEDES